MSLSVIRGQSALVKSKCITFHFEAADDYQVLFEDPSYADGYSPPLQVAQRNIITVPENKKKGGK